MLDKFHSQNVKKDIGAFGETEYKQICNVYQVNFKLLSFTVMTLIAIKK